MTERFALLGTLCSVQRWPGSVQRRPGSREGDLGVRVDWLPSKALNGDRSRVARRLGAGLLQAVALAAAIAVGVGVGSGGGGALAARLPLALGAVAGLALVSLAATRYWVFLLVLFSIRSTLDVFQSGYENSLFDPSTAVGAVFLGSAIVWLLAQRRSRRLVAPSRMCRAVFFLAGVSVLSAIGARAPLASFQTSMKVVSSAVMLLVLEQVFHQKPERIRALLAASFASFVVPALAALAQIVGLWHLSVDPYEPVSLARVRGTFVHPSVLGSYLAMFIVFGAAMFPHLEARWRFAVASMCVLASVLLLFTYSRGPWLAAIIGLFIVGAAQSRRLFLALVVGLVAVVLLVPSVTTRLSDLGGSESATQVDKNSVSWRFGYWKSFLPEAKDNPVTGIGLDMIQKFNPEHYAPHNVFLQALVELGGLGLIALLTVIGFTWADLLRAKRRVVNGFERGLVLGASAVAFGLLLQMLSDNLLTQTVTQWYFLVPVAWAVAVVAPRPTPPAPEAREATGDTLLHARH